MKFTIVNKQILAKDVKRIDVRAAELARAIQPGQFVMVIPKEGSAWLPLAVVESDERRGTVSFILNEVGETSRELGNISINSAVFSVMGPLGAPAAIKKYGTVVCVADSSGIAQILPVSRALKKAGNKVIGIIVSKDKNPMMLETQMRLSCQKLQIVTEGAPGNKGMTAAAAVKEQLDRERIALVYCISGPRMMRDVCALTREKSVKTLVQLNAAMFCGTGICGSCRVTVGRKTALCCQDGPEFDGHRVDFDEYQGRLQAYRDMGEEDTIQKEMITSASWKRMFSGMSGGK